MYVKYPIRKDMILVALNSKYVYIRKDVFEALFENSHVYYKSSYRKALDDNRIKFRVLQDLSREAGIPYSLFFAPMEKVEANIKQSNENIFKGVQDVPIAIASRGDIKIRDVNLIIKDIQKRQQLMARNHREIGPNVIINLRQHEDISEFAKLIIKTLGLDMDKFRSYATKRAAYEYLVTTLEYKNIIISRSRRGYMPQTIKNGLNFSGFAVRHKKYPAIFLHSKDEDNISDPAGRRIFTIILLLTYMANKRFAIVSYNQSTKEPTRNIEYIIAEEILMPESAISGIRLSNLDELNEIADAFKVTPSMALVRLRRLSCISDETFEKLLETLNNKWQEASSQKSNFKFGDKTKEATKVITYNGRLFTLEVINLLRAGKLSPGDASRLLVFRKRSGKILDELKEKL